MKTFIGHRLAVTGDLRREFNEISNRIFICLAKEESGPTPDQSGPSATDLQLVRKRMSWRRRRKFDKALAAYRNSKSEDNCATDDDGRVFYKDTQHVRDSIEQLIFCTHWK